MNIGRRHWLAAFALALVAHGSLVLLLWKPAESGAANLGVGGMEVAFGTAGGAPGATEVPPPEVEPVDAPETDAVEPQETPPLEVVEAVETAEAVEVEAVEPPVAESIPVREAKPNTVTARIPKKPLPPREVKAVEPKPAPAPPKEVAAKPPADRPSTSAPSVAGSDGKSGTEKSSNTGDGKDTSSGGRPGSADSYFARLQAWLEQHKEYPLSARRRRREGTAVLNFTMDRSGAILEASILRGTGHASLDEEVMRMIRRASPLPPFPGDFTDARLTLSVPVQFQLH